MREPDSEALAGAITELARRIRRTARTAAGEARARGTAGDLAHAVGRGEGDTTFRLDQVTERTVDEWLAERARDGNLSLLTEDAGWRHRGPAGALAGFDHGGPRIACDPVDGTRHLMHDLRSAWTVLAVAGPGRAVPRLSDVELGVVSELPDSRAGRARVVTARRGAGCRLALVELPGEQPASEQLLVADADLRVDRGYFPFFAFHPATRAPLTRLATGFLERLAEEQGADLATVLDDQYIASAGQLVHVATGTYRMVVDARAWLAERGGPAEHACKPYDLSGAVLCAREAGAVVLDLEGRELDFPLDARTPVSFCAFANRPTCERLWPVLERSLAELQL